eukprot:tig00000849_g4768.t1
MAFVSSIPAVRPANGLLSAASASCAVRPSALKSEFAGRRFAAVAAPARFQAAERVPKIVCSDDVDVAEKPAASPFKPSQAAPADDIMGSVDIDALLAKPKEILADATKRPTVYLKNAAIVGVGMFALLLASSISNGFHRVPLLPNLFQLIGFGYTVWFAYRFLLFANTRQELRNKIEDFLGRL